MKKSRMQRLPHTGFLHEVLLKPCLFAHFLQQTQIHPKTNFSIMQDDEKRHLFF